jgi:hypothetical protein
MDNLNRLDFSKRRNDNCSYFHTGVVLHEIMIEWINFYSIIFSQKEMGIERHMADVVLLAGLGGRQFACDPLVHLKKEMKLNIAVEVFIPTYVCLLQIPVFIVRWNP